MIDNMIPHLIILTLIVAAVFAGLKFKLVEITPIALSPERKRALGVAILVISLMGLLGRLLQSVNF